MLSRLILCVSIASVSAPSYAGFFDFLTSGDDKEQATEPAAAPVAKSTSSDMLSQGLALLPLLTQSLNVSDTQASGGMGALLQAAQALLSKGDFGTLADAIPNASSLLADAPKLTEKSSGGSDLLNSAMDLAAEHNDTAKTASNLASQFKSLGLSTDMIPKFTETANGFLKQNGNSEASDLLTSALGGLF